MGRAYLNSFNEWKKTNEDNRIAFGSFVLGSFLSKAALYSEAESLLKISLQINEHIGNNHQKVSACLSNLATVLKETNRISEAEPLMRRALKLSENKFGKESPKLLMI